MKTVTARTAAAGAPLRYYEAETPRAIMQNVEIIMSTPQGTVPMAMTFGTDQSYIDSPVPEARIRMIAPLREAIEEWEPRVRVIQIYDRGDGSDRGQLTPVAEVVINGT